MNIMKLTQFIIRCSSAVDNITRLRQRLDSSSTYHKGIKNKLKADINMGKVHNYTPTMEHLVLTANETRQHTRNINYVTMQ